MTQMLEHPLATGTVPELPRRLWRVAGVLILAHVALLFAGISQEKLTVLTDSPADVQRTYAGGSLGRVLAGGYLEALSFIVLLPALVFLARALGRRTEAGRWAAQTSLAAGVAFVASTLAVGLPAGAAAVYGAHHRLADAGTLALVNDVRNFAFFLSLMALGLHAVSTGVAALSDGVLQRWVGWGGVVTGALLLLALTVQQWIDAVNITNMVWLVWWVGVGVTALRLRDA